MYFLLFALYQHSDKVRACSGKRESESGENQKMEKKRVGSEFQ